MTAVTFGARLRQLREAKGMSQRELGDRVGIDFTYISKVENGKLLPFSARRIVMLAPVLGVDAEELLILGDKPPVAALRQRVVELEAEVKRLRSLLGMDPD